MSESTENPRTAMTDTPPSPEPVASSAPVAPSELDPFSRLLGMELVSVGLGTATVQMTIGPNHVNPHGTPHGGAIFSLADSALAVASNSHGIEAVALDLAVTYCRPAPMGSVVTATCSEINLTKSTGLYDIRVEREDGKLVASLKATVFRTGRPFKGWSE